MNRVSIDTTAVSEARQRIEHVRKSDYVIKLEDNQGNPVTGEVEIKLKSHEFRFGGFIAGRFNWGKELDQKIKDIGLEVVAELFNMVTICYHWGHAQTDPNQANWDWGRAELDYEWARSHGLEARWHSVVYPNPNAMSHYNCKAVTTEQKWWELTEEFIAQLAMRWGNLIHEYDIINEANFTHDVPFVYEWYKENMLLYPDIRKPEIAAKIFEIARRYLPDARLVALNDWPMGLHDHKWFRFNKEHYKALKDLGAPVDIYGWQGHFCLGMEAEALDLANISHGLDSFGELGRVAITEYNPPSRSSSSRSGRMKHEMNREEIAEWSEGFYTIAFSKPYITGVTRWCIIDDIGCDKVDGGLVTLQGELSPEYYILKRLLKKEWVTNEKLVTDQNGKVVFRGFHGTYAIKVNGVDCSPVVLSKANNEITVKV